MRKNAYDMIYLIACVLHDQAPDPDRIQKINMRELYDMAQYHSLTAVTAMSLEKIWSQLSSTDDIERRWKQAKEKAIRKNILLDTERERIFSYMESNGIWYVSLKGIILKDLYPKYGMRQMSDNDILYDSEYQEQIFSFMKNCGYKVKMYKKINHDSYIKPPVYNYEMHSALFRSSNGEKFVEYYSNIKEKLLLDENKKYCYHFNPEDFYIYITAHSYKHYKKSGTGLRSLVDCYVYWNYYGASLDVDYIETELKKLEILDFERMCRSLSNKIFDDTQYNGEANLTFDESKALDRFIFSGTYGTFDNRVKSELQDIEAKNGSKRYTKLSYYKKRIFINENQLENCYPFFYKYKIFLPVLWVFRIFRAVLFRRNKLKKEISLVKTYFQQENN